MRFFTIPPNNDSNGTSIHSKAATFVYDPLTITLQGNTYKYVYVHTILLWVSYLYFIDIYISTIS